MLIFGLILAGLGICIAVYARLEQRGLEMSAAGTGLLFVYVLATIFIGVGGAFAAFGAWS
jgi:hypothetical protein